MHEWLSGYRFTVTLGSFMAGFQKISGIGGKTEPEYLHEGGQSFSYPLMGAKNPGGKLTFEKGYGTRNPFGGDGGFAVGTRIKQPCSIIVLDASGQPRRVYAFDNGLILSWESSPLDAENGGLLIDKVEIAHTGLYEANPDSVKVRL